MMVGTVQQCCSLHQHFFNTEDPSDLHACHHGETRSLSDIIPSLLFYCKRAGYNNLNQHTEPYLLTAVSRSQLYNEATLDAIRYENACSPIVRSVTRSYISVARR